ncbi:hypothetical protein [Streptomyces sp. SJL17-4]|uniref:hypothetical protein n=1 Tax=Streptomyces sp. SJL17-4 TaxID=2967224 RepID=UPI0030CAF80E
MNNNLNRSVFMDGKRDKGKMRANVWQRDDRMERLAVLRDSHPEMFERLGATARMSLGYYENDKQIAAQYGRDVNEGGK